MIIFHLKAIMKFLHSIVLSSCTNGTVRLMNGSTSDEGRVEVCVNGEWGGQCVTVVGIEEKLKLFVDN